MGVDQNIVELAPALALPCALQGFLRVLLNKYTGFNVPLRSAISIRLGNLSKENAKKLHGKPCRLIPVMKVCMQNKFLVESKAYKTITMTGKGNSVLAP